MHNFFFKLALTKEIIQSAYDMLYYYGTSELVNYSARAFYILIIVRDCNLKDQPMIDLVRSP
jgi:hypothetical protein